MKFLSDSLISTPYSIHEISWFVAKSALPLFMEIVEICLK